MGVSERDGEESTPEEEISLFCRERERAVSYTNWQYNKAVESVEGGGREWKRVCHHCAGGGNRVWGLSRPRARLLDRFMHTECISSHSDASHAWTIDL